MIVAPMNEMFRKTKLLGIAFIALEAVMHVYLAIYLIAIKASFPAVGFTIFEMVMFFYLLAEKKFHKRQDR